MRTMLVSGVALFAVAVPLAEARAPARDRFSGKIRSGTGAYAHATGRMGMVANVSRDGKHFTLRLTGLRCRVAGCLSLSGKLTGRVRPPKHATPDIGCIENLSGGGKLSRLGRVTVNGHMHGTGFEDHGREDVHFTLTNRRGTVRVNGISPVVKGFTCPG